jgi:hypothetical protein
MSSRTLRQSLVWGVLLIVAGVLLVLNQLTELSPWVWVLALGACGLGALGLYLADRSDWAMLISAYALLAIALLVALVTLDVLRNEAVAFYVLSVIALAFVGVFVRDRAQWWALIPAYVLLAVGVMVGLIGLGLLDDLLVPAYVLFAIALPFFVIFARDRRLWWALIPGGVLALVGLTFLIAEAAFAYIGALVPILIGVWILVRAFTRRGPVDQASPLEPSTPPTTSPEPDQRAEGGEE